MKKTILLITLSFFYHFWVISQPCLPQGIIFTRQTEIDSFQINYPNCTEIEGSVFINDVENGNITNLVGLSVLNRIGTQLSIEDNDSLTSLAGLENLYSIGLNLLIRSNKNLTSIADLESLCYVQGVILIEESNSLLTLEGLEKLDTMKVLNIIGNESLEHLHNLSNLIRVTNEFLIENNQSLSNLSGLENLIYAGEDVKIFNNDLLTDLNGLNNLKYIVGLLKIRYNDQLSSLNGLENLDTINMGISINDNLILTSLESIVDSYINLAFIHNNPMLEVCNINSICRIILNNPEDAEIYDNAPGCNSVEEVEDLCLVYQQEFYNESYLNLYPNPAYNEINIGGINPDRIDNLQIYNILSQSVIIENSTNKIDISNLKKGIYVIEVSSKGKIYRKKFIKR